MCFVPIVHCLTDNDPRDNDYIHVAIIICRMSRLRRIRLMSPENRNRGGGMKFSVFERTRKRFQKHERVVSSRTDHVAEMFPFRFVFTGIRGGKLLFCRLGVMPR